MRASIHKALKELKNIGGGDNPRNGTAFQDIALKGRKNYVALSGLRMCAHLFTGVICPVCAISPFQGFTAELAEVELNTTLNSSTLNS